MNERQKEKGGVDSASREEEGDTERRRANQNKEEITARNWMCQYIWKLSGFLV